MRELDRYVQRAARIADGDLWRRSPALALAQALGDIMSDDDSEVWAQQLEARPYDPALPNSSGGVAVMPRHDDERETISAYLRAVVTAHADADETIDDRFFDDDRSDERRALFRSARVYHVDGVEYARAHRAADVVTTREFVGEDWREHSPERAPGAAIEMLNLGIQRCGPSTPFPALPFPSVYVGFGSGVGLHETNARAYLGGAHSDRTVIGFVLCGFMLSERESFAHFRMLLVDGRQTHGLVQMHDGDQWLAPMSLAPWIVNAIVGTFATEAGPRTLPTFAMKRDAKKLSREVGQTIKPPAFYRVTVRRSTTSTSTTTEREQGERAPLSFRFDVSAHDRVLVRRGDAATIDPRERVRLTRLGWRWYDDGDDVPDEARALLATRGRAAPSSGEWLAIKIVRVRSHERGPEGARVPSLRVIAGEGESK